MSSRKYLSGSEKHKQKRGKQNEREKQKNAILSYFATAHEHEEVQHIIDDTSIDSNANPWPSTSGGASLNALSSATETEKENSVAQNFRQNKCYK